MDLLTIFGGLTAMVISAFIGTVVNFFFGDYLMKVFPSQIREEERQLHDMTTKFKAFDADVRKFVIENVEQNEQLQRTAETMTEQVQKCHLEAMEVMKESRRLQRESAKAIMEQVKRLDQDVRMHMSDSRQQNHGLQQSPAGHTLNNQKGPPMIDLKGLTVPLGAASANLKFSWNYGANAHFSPPTFTNSDSPQDPSRPFVPPQQPTMPQLQLHDEVQTAVQEALQRERELIARSAAKASKASEEPDSDGFTPVTKKKRWSPNQANDEKLGNFPGVPTALRPKKLPASPVGLGVQTGGRGGSGDDNNMFSVLGSNVKS